MNRFQSYGEATHPCLTPLRVSNQLVYAPLILTQELEHILKDYSAYINPILTLCMDSFLHRLKELNIKSSTPAQCPLEVVNDICHPHDDNICSRRLKVFSRARSE
ncbi:hypothetical protein EVAR_31217_1 [Eumeta japonica]|uniref:Uncharacterized protein n=1 Tax=Eumeta variegata TaxID=151549 RepID=A0A4C1W2B1_EUMVA|nr:hypothetical protein EVAR_31217_1 [Eumeta japonica]